MKVEKFEQILKNNNALFLDDDYVIFNDYELYSRKRDKSIYNKTLNDLLECEVNGKKFKELLETIEEFYLQDSQPRLRRKR